MLVCMSVLTIKFYLPASIFQQQMSKTQLLGIKHNHSFKYRGNLIIYFMIDD